MTPEQMEKAAIVRRSRVREQITSDLIEASDGSWVYLVMVPENVEVHVVKAGS